ncbi:MAG TPA: DNA recombination/repair protein RecA, partial [Candidatus Dojkabacteria bacterium]|nr:DNA recombination/repair protein RecA [Candidatus Dojkabacteria bacterium]
FSIIYPKGIDKESSIIDAAISKNVIEKAGSWLKYGEKQLAQGKEQAIELLREDVALRNEIESKVRATLK